MALNFPGSPTDGQTYAVGEKVYVWSASQGAWKRTSSGETGPMGPTGPQGIQGTIGLQGLTGLQGEIGPTGLQGQVGPQGTTGDTGAQGVTGTQGLTGIQGDVGAQGTTGAQGVQGTTGAQGSTGTQGLTGFQGTTGADANFNVIDAAGDLLVGSADNTVGRLALGSNGTVLTVDTAGAGVNKVKWAAAPDPIPSQTGNANRLLTTNGTTTSWTNTLTNLVQLAPEERFNVVASAATGSINIDFLTAAVWYYTTNASANHTINFRGNASNTLNAMLATGDAITVGWIINNGTTAYYPTTIQIDGSGVTPNWLNGSAPPASAQANQTAGIDAFTFTIIKTAATPTYRVLGSWAQYR